MRFESGETQPDGQGIGHGDIDGFGNAVANNLKGNSGDNRLEGGGGMDYFKSGKGDDVLVGGTESDLFYFAKHHDDDTIIDFQTGLDVIKLVDWIPAQGFDDIMAYTSNVRGNAVISFEDSSLTLLGVLKSELSATDFVFVA